MDDQICPICDRLLDGKNISQHHLIPVSCGGSYSELIKVHKICHDKIHSIFTNKELKEYYHTVERLRMSSEMQEFIWWLKDRPSNFYVNTKRNKRKDERKIGARVSGTKDWLKIGVGKGFK